MCARRAVAGEWRRTCATARGRQPLEAMSVPPAWPALQGTSAGRATPRWCRPLREHQRHRMTRRLAAARMVMLCPASTVSREADGIVTAVTVICLNSQLLGLVTLMSGSHADSAVGAYNGRNLRWQEGWPQTGQCRAGEARSRVPRSARYGW
jgi:hypothetical protein